MKRIKNITADNEGQITLSSDALKQLNVEEGGTLIEFVKDGYVILLPRNQVLEQLRAQAQMMLAGSSTTVNELNAEIECLKSERFARDYPEL